MIRTNSDYRLTDRDVQELTDDYLRDVYGQTIEVCGYAYDPGYALRRIDPIAYDEVLAIYTDSQGLVYDEGLEYTDAEIDAMAGAALSTALPFVYTLADLDPELEGYPFAQLQVKEFVYRRLVEFYRMLAAPVIELIEAAHLTPWSEVLMYNLGSVLPPDYYQEEVTELGTTLGDYLESISEAVPVINFVVGADGRIYAE